MVEKIKADVREGTRRDGILHAVGANATHGNRRTNEDKRRAIVILLNDLHPQPKRRPMPKVVTDGVVVDAGIGDEIWCTSCGCRWQVEEADVYQRREHWGRWCGYYMPCPQCVGGKATFDPYDRAFPRDECDP